jgi:hypothetical protein
VLARVELLPLFPYVDAPSLVVGRGPSGHDVVGLGGNVKLYGNDG